MAKKVVLNTAGNGLWSDVEKAVTITELRLGYVDDDGYSHGELRVYFKGWDITEDGLIYTDRLFMRELRAYLDSIGLPGKDVDYSEQGMQGDDYVSCDIGRKFIEAWGKKHGIAVPRGDEEERLRRVKVKA